MARTIGLLRILAMTIIQPDKLLAKLNDRLCINNETNLFVTMFCGFLDVETGKLVYSNGGHCPPILAEGGQTRELAIPKGPLVGAFPGARFVSMTHELILGNTLYCYTDGVTEAQNKAGEEFSEERCNKALDEVASQPLLAVLEAVRHKVAEFSGTGILEDDFTMLAIRRTASGMPKSMQHNLS